MRGQSIIVSTPANGRRLEGVVKTGETHNPGAIHQVDPTVALSGGVFTFKIYDRDADGDRPAGGYWVCTDELMRMEGKVITDLDTFDTYAAGTRASYYCPLPGDELNLLFKNVGGTADDVVAGNLFIVDDTTGKVIVTTGTVESEPAMALEALTDPTADSLVWSMWSHV